MEVRRFDDVAAFFTHAAPFLERREAEHNLILGLRGRLERDPHTFGEEDPYLAVAEACGEIVGVAFRTPPHAFGLSEIDDLAAVDAFLGDARGMELNGVIGPVAASERFALHWQQEAGVTARIAIAERIYAASEAFPPTGVPGRYREYGPEDRDVAAAWLDAFTAEALAEAPARQEDGASFVARREADPDGGLVIWEHDGTPVSLAGHGSPTPNGVRVGPVYTPPELRGRGYASALVGELTARLLAGGRRYCFLYTDLSNPTSNSIYQRVGYRPVSDVTAWRFDPA